MPTFSFDVTASEATRLQAQVGRVLQLGGPASGAQAKAFIIQRIKSFVLEQEREEYLGQHTDAPFDPT